MGYPISQNFRWTLCTAFFSVYPISQYFSRRVCTSFASGYPISQIFRKRYAPSSFEISKVHILAVFILRYVLQSEVQFYHVQFNCKNLSIVKLSDISFLISVDPFHPSHPFYPYHPQNKAFPKCQKCRCTSYVLKVSKSKMERPVNGWLDPMVKCSRRVSSVDNSPLG